MLEAQVPALVMLETQVPALVMLETQVPALLTQAMALLLQMALVVLETQAPALVMEVMALVLQAMTLVELATQLPTMTMTTMMKMRKQEKQLLSINWVTVSHLQMLQVLHTGGGSQRSNKWHQ